MIAPLYLEVDSRANLLQERVLELLLERLSEEEWFLPITPPPYTEVWADKEPHE